MAAPRFRTSVLNKREIIKTVLLGPFWVVGNRLIDEVTGDLDNMNTFVVYLKRNKELFATGLMLQCYYWNETISEQTFTIAVSSRAISKVPVTKRKMMKMLMILSSDRSNHTIICVHGEEGKTHRGRTTSQYNSEGDENTQLSDT